MSRPKRRIVLHLLPSDQARGAQVYARALCDELNVADHDSNVCHVLMTVLASKPGPAKPDHELGVRPGAGELLVGAVKLAKAFRRLEPSLVVAHGSGALKFVRFARFSGPLVLLRIGTNAATLDSSGARRRFHRWLQRSADAVVAVSTEALADAVKLGLPDETPRSVIVNGRDPAVFRPGVEKRSSVPHIAFVGHLFQGKRPDRFVRVVERLRPNYEFRASIAGDGPMRNEIAEAAARSEIDMLGSVEDVASFLQTVDILVFCSEPENEGMPGILIEASLCEVAVVATRVPGVDAVLEDSTTGRVVRESEGNELENAVGDLLEDPHACSRFGAAARQRCIERFSLASTIEQWQDVLDHALSFHDSRAESRPRSASARPVAAHCDESAVSPTP